MFGAGGNSVISRALGTGDREKAKQTSAFVCYAAIIFGVLMTVGVLIFMEPLLKLIGTDAETHDFVKEYLTWIGLGAAFSIFGGVFSNVIRSEGASGDAMIGNIAGSITNIILDPIMILGLDMGVQGAAVVTVIGNMTACAIYASYFFRKPSQLSIRPRDFRPTGRLAWEVISIGLPSAATSCSPRPPTF